MSIIILSLLFVTPYVNSFSIGDLGDMIGYVLFNSFQIITGQVTATDCSAAGGECKSSCGNGESQVSYSCVDEEMIDTPSIITGLAVADVCCLPDGPLPSVCGDGDIEEGEECDRGVENTNDPSSCDGTEFGLSCSYCTTDCALIEVTNDDCMDTTCFANPTECDGAYTFDCNGLDMCGPFGECIDAPEDVGLCGNNIINELEICDSAELNNKTCITQGYESGNLTCESDCLSFDVSSCVAGNDDPNPDDSDNSQDTVAAALTCASINGMCTDECGVNYEHYNGTNDLDGDCVERHGEGLICCIPSYLLNGDSDNDPLTEDDSFTGTVKSVEDYMAKDQKAAKSAPSYTFEGGLKQILSSPYYAMGGVWVVFVLTAVVVGLTYYLHTNVGPKRKKKKR